MASYSSALPNRTRVGGSGFTAFFWMGKPLGFCRQLAHTAPTPVGPGPTPIQPLDEPYPIDIITPAAQTVGTLQLEMYELYNRKIWDQLHGDLGDGSEVAGSIDLVNIFIKLAAASNPIQVVKLIQPPTLRGKAPRKYMDVFHNCVISNIEDGETIEIGTMEITKRMTIMYTNVTRQGHWDNIDKKNYAYALRDAYDDKVRNDYPIR